MGKSWFSRENTNAGGCWQSLLLFDAGEATDQTTPAIKSGYC
jgi:hypothetical protein